MTDLLSDCNVKLFISSMVWFWSCEMIEHIDVFFWDSLIFEYLWFHIFFYFLWWCLCVLGPFLNFWRNDYLDFDHLRLKIVFSVPFKVKWAFLDPFILIFLFLDLAWGFFSIWWLFWQQIHLICQYIPYLKKNMGPLFKDKGPDKNSFL